MMPDEYTDLMLLFVMGAALALSFIL